MIKRIRDNIREVVSSEFYRNIAGLFSGIFFARLIPAFFALAIARLYAPGDFGIFVLFLSIASLLSILSTGGYERALLLAETTEEKQHIFRFSLKTNFIINALTLVVLGIYIAASRKSDLCGILMLLMIPVFSFFFGGLQLIRNILISNKMFKELSLLEVIRALAAGGLQTLLFILPGTGLFIGIVLAQMVTFVIYFVRLPETSSFRFGSYHQRELDLARRYIDFPRYSVPSELFNYLSSQLPVFLIKPFFGGTMLGLYSFPHRYLSIPVQLTSISIGSVYVQKAQSLKKSPDELSKVTYELFTRQFMLAILPFTVLALWGNDIFRFAFGSEWAFSGTLGQLMAPWLFAVFIGSPLSSILVVMEKQKVSLIFNVVMLLFRALALTAGGLFLKDITLTVALYSLAGFVSFALLTLYSLRLAHVNLIKTFWFCFRIFLMVTIPLLILKIWL